MPPPADCPITLTQQRDTHIISALSAKFSRFVREGSVMKFSKRHRSYQFAACNRLAATIAKAAHAMNLQTKTDTSRQSASVYLVVSCDDFENDLTEIRCSDHDDRHPEKGRLYAWTGESAAPIIARLAEHYNKAIPPGFAEADFTQRSASAEKAAKARSQQAFTTESQEIDAVTNLLQQSKTIGVIAAGRAVDTLFPCIPRAKRQRIAQSATYRVKKTRALTAAGQDPEKLAALSKTYDEARKTLYTLVGPERFPSLRPKGFVRKFWIEDIP